MDRAEKKSKTVAGERDESEHRAAEQKVRRRKREQVHKSSECDSEEGDKSEFKRRKGESTRQFLERVNFEADQRLFASQKKARKCSTKRKE